MVYIPNALPQIKSHRRSLSSIQLSSVGDNATPHNVSASSTGGRINELSFSEGGQKRKKEAGIKINRNKKKKRNEKGKLKVPIKNEQPSHPVFPNGHAIIHGYINRVLLKKWPVSLPLHLPRSLYCPSSFFSLSLSFSLSVLLFQSGPSKEDEFCSMGSPHIAWLSPTGTLIDGVCTACTIWCRCALWGLERLRMVEMAYIRKLTRTQPVLRFGEPYWEDISDLVCEMGLTGNHLITLLLYVAVVNEIRLPLVSSFFSVYDSFHLAAFHSIVSCYDRPCFAAISLLICV